MPSQKQTTVILTEKAQTIKEDLAPVFGLKNILSAGLILLGGLSADGQKKVISEANIPKDSEPPKIDTKERQKPCRYEKKKN